MNKLVIFDLDGVMIDSREMHYETLNAAITRVTGSTQYVITREEHLSKYDGLNTTRKLRSKLLFSHEPRGYLKGPSFFLFSDFLLVEFHEL